MVFSPPHTAPSFHLVHCSVRHCFGQRRGKPTVVEDLQALDCSVKLEGRVLQLEMCWHACCMPGASCKPYFRQILITLCTGRWEVSVLHQVSEAVLQINVQLGASRTATLADNSSKIACITC